MTLPEPRESARGMYAFHLKRLREEHGLSQPALGKKVHVSASLISGIENCTRTPSPKLSAAFDAYFGIPEFFTALQPRVVEEIGLPAGFLEYTDVEAEANMIKLYENFVIHGLLQTEEYARSVLSAGNRPDKIDRLVATRVERQAILYREEPPMLIALLDEFALHRPFGGREVMRRQYEHLLKLAAEPRVALHMVPGDAELCPEGAFAILTSSESPPMGYVESAGRKGLLIEAGQHLAELEVLFELIRNKALSDTDTERMIRDLMEKS
ncbi:helix-turn-helix transcriptional regulator [Actinocorallia aurantiaca]|uniref:Helix-turn-helix transcriptional regulator n=1 Tax=Actinocorallia aurantiaca TaxID=46204 RepID=A0ABP6H7Q1_9ACTN